MIDFIARWFVFAQVQVNPGDTKLPRNAFDNSTFEKGLNVVFGIFGAISVIVITVAGFQYVMSQGDPQATGKAKNAIIDALIGLLITILAYGIVNFVVTRL